MVNVAGRSKACRNCKRRRVGCDEKRPKCDRCRKARLECEGYSYPLVFVHEDPKSRQEKRNLREETANRLLIPRYLYPAALPTAEDYAQLSYLVKSLHVDDERFLSARWRKDAFIIEQDPVSTASLALRALAATFFGRMHAHKPSVARGTALYGQALTKMARELSEGTNEARMTHVVAALNLSMHEMAMPTMETTWMSHARGAQQIMNMFEYNPKFFSKEPARSVFARARSILIVQAIIDRRRSFFERSEWRTVPWSDDPDAKSALDRLVDIMCFLPGIYEDTDIIATLKSDTKQQGRRQKMLARLKSHITLLLSQTYRFRWAWEFYHPACCYEVPEPPDSPFGPNILFRTNLRCANEITLYNSVLFMLLELARELLAPLPDPAALFVTKGPIPISTNPLRLPGDGDSERAAATEICRCAEFHMADPSNIAGPYFLLFPLAIARREFCEDEAKTEWIERLLKRIHDRGVFDAEAVVR